MPNKSFIVNMPDGRVSIIHPSYSDPTRAITDDAEFEQWAVDKTLFELSRTTDMETHFDPAVHTREAIAAGIAGHSALALTAECEDSDLPTDRYFRNAWEWSD
jgi:hypothetical protein